MTFLGDIVVARSPGRISEWTLVKELTYVGHTDHFRVPKGFKTDFASIPGVFHSLIPKNGKHDAAAIIHDYLYRHQPLVWNRSGGAQRNRITRKDADRIFRRIMKELGVGRFRRNVMYQAVRLGGRGPWKRSKKLLDG